MVNRYAPETPIDHDPLSLTLRAMSKPEYFVTPGYGDRNRNLFNYSQAVRFGDRVEISGQGGWNDDWEFPESLRDEIVQAFDNIERTITLAGAMWEHVVHVNSYHLPTSTDSIGDDHLGVMVEQFKIRMPGHAPIWTCIGVPALGDPKMRVEIRVTAILAE
jgi:enamine deaminase RidA (YjgF/YER057c/UK114 family)